MSEIASGPTPEQIAARGATMCRLSGRGLFLSTQQDGDKRRFTRERWEALCIQAVAWGISVLHPKIADGGYWWYDLPDLNMLQSVATSHDLKVFPVITSYGNAYGALSLEEGIIVTAGTIFDGLVLEMGQEWETAEATSWSVDMGQVVRAQCPRPLLIKRGADPSLAKFPWLEVLSWASGWMPTLDQITWPAHQSAQTTIFSLTPIWSQLNRGLWTHGIFPPPILPVIELGTVLSPEVVSWLSTVKGCGYCGFTDDEAYPTYAEAIRQAPEPSWSPTPVPPVPVSSTPTSVPATPAPAPIADTPVPTPEPQPETILPTFSEVTGMRQHLSVEQLQVSWSVVTQLPFDLGFPITQCWAMLLEAAYGIGAPTGPVQDLTANAITVKMQPFEGGRIFLQESNGSSQVWVMPVNQPRLPGTAPASNGFTH